MVAPRRTGLQRVYLFGLVAVAIGLVVGLVLWNTALTSLIRPSSGYQPPIKMEGGTLPPLDLIDQYGKPFSLEMVKGKPVFVYFGYTNCPDVCPVVLQKFAKTIRALGSDADKIAFIFVSVDPWRDTPEAMREYVNKYFDPRIIALTGPVEKIEQLILQYKIPVYYTDEKGNPVNPAELPPGTRYFVNHFAWVIGADRNHNVRLALTPEMEDKEYIDAARWLISQ
jgi:protein SCO1/2